MKKILVVGLMGLLTLSIAQARRGGGAKFFQAKLQACEGKAAGEVCSFSGRKGDKSGTCQQGRKGGGKLFCKGEGKGKRGKGKYNKEEWKAKRKARGEAKKLACEGKSAGEACSFASRKGEKAGTCSASRRDANVLVCKRSK